MTDLEKLISLQGQLLDMQKKLRAIGDHSLVIIKGCEDINRSSSRAPHIIKVRDQAIKINYLAHDMYDNLERDEHFKRD